jgi:hypothetical protein
LLPEKWQKCIGSNGEYFAWCCYVLLITSG